MGSKIQFKNEVQDSRIPDRVQEDYCEKVS
jgi:hypothetical protein